MHELSLVDHSDEHVVSLLSMQGSWRSVWNVLGGQADDEDDEDDKGSVEVPNTSTQALPQVPQAVLKLLKFSSREFDHESYRYHQTDAMAMERLTSSRHIVDAYGYCGQSVLTEYMPLTARERVKHKLSSVERLLLGRELARALADVHSIDGGAGHDATLAHNDLNMANVVVSVEGKLKLNDFNIGVLMRRNGSEPCGYPSRFHNPLWKSPEEIRNVTYIDPAQSDMYSIGNVLFQIMTKHQPWTHLEPNGAIPPEVVGQRKLQGFLPTFPDKFLASNKTATQAMLYAVLSCYRKDPHKRLTAEELAVAMETALVWVRKGKRVPRKNVLELFVKKKRKYETIDEYKANV
jgi:serine/threonine protein kinase